MRTCAEAVKELIERDPIAYEALGRSLLNAHAYARSIQSEVEIWCKKPVKVNTVVIALTRLQKTLKGKETLVPSFRMGSITVKSGLMELALMKGEISFAVAKWLSAQKKATDEFSLVIDGNREIDFIFSEQLFPLLEKRYDLKASMHGSVNHLVAITLSYDSELTFVPNVGYTLMRALALRHINVVEVVSSYSEVTFLVSASDMDESLIALKQFL